MNVSAASHDRGAVPDLRRRRFAATRIPRRTSEITGRNGAPLLRRRQDYREGGTTTTVLPPEPVLPFAPVAPSLPWFPVAPCAPSAPVSPVLP